MAGDPQLPSTLGSDGEHKFARLLASYHAKPAAASGDVDMGVGMIAAAG